MQHLGTKHSELWGIGKYRMDCNRATKVRNGITRVEQNFKMLRDLLRYKQVSNYVRYTTYKHCFCMRFIAEQLSNKTTLKQ